MLVAKKMPRWNNLYLALLQLALHTGQVMQRRNAASWLLLALLSRASFAQAGDWATTETVQAPSGTVGPGAGVSREAEVCDLNRGFDDLHYGPWQLVEVRPQEPASPAAPAAPPAEKSNAATSVPVVPAAEHVIDPLVIEQARAGDSVAQYKLGYDYYLGRGIAQDYIQAAIWWQKAAEQGFPQAQNNIGVLYNSGKGVPQSYSEAYFWQNLAAARANGSLQAQFAKNRDDSAAKLSIWERLRVQKRAAKWASEHPVAAKP
jgi:TPR repeat protein